MEEKANNKKSGKVKTFFKGLVEKMDKKMQEKAKNSGCCCNNDKPQGNGLVSNNQSHKPGDKSCCG